MRTSTLPVLLVSVPLLCSASLASAQGTEVRTGVAAIDDNWKTDAPGVRRHIKPSDLPARREYERLHGRQSEPAFLEVLVKDPDFAWLGALTALIVRLDEALEEGDALQGDWIEQIRKLLTPGMAGGDFNRKYEQLTQQLPEIVVAHGEVMRALRAYRPQSCGTVSSASPHSAPRRAN